MGSGSYWREVRRSMLRKTWRTKSERRQRRRMRREKGRKKRGWKERLTAPHIIPEDKGCSELFLYEHFHLCGS